MHDDLEQALGQVFGAAIGAARPLHGGDINDAYQITLDSGRLVFVKAHAGAPHAMFECEARGLSWLGEAGALRVPAVLAVGAPPGPAFLALEHIAPGRRHPRHDELLGHGLARLHRAGAPGFGLAYDNFLATLPQDNTTAPDWATFYSDRRLRPLARRAACHGAMPRSLASRVDRLCDRLAALAGPDEPPARLHGDLWSGNLHSDEDGSPCLIDPAVYGGHREVDLAMLELFGSPGARFLAAYEEVYPLAPGRRERVALYQLYPLLCHVNLFGGAYVAALDAALSRYE